MKAFTVNSNDLRDKNINPKMSLSVEDALTNAAMPKSPYDKQAEDFLRKNGLVFKATFKGDKCPLWCKGDHKHGDRYWITLTRKTTKQRVGFEFWNSLKDVSEKAPLLPYSVLACVSGDIHCPDSFIDFCSEFGYSTDSRRAEKTFNACHKLNQKLRAFFSDEEIDQLSEIS